MIHHRVKLQQKPTSSFASNKLFSCQTNMKIALKVKRLSQMSPKFK